VTISQATTDDYQAASSLLWPVWYRSTPLSQFRPQYLVAEASQSVIGLAGLEGDGSVS
jgi:hypothetical protein